MSLQNIIDRAATISIQRNRVAAKTISRSGRLLTAEVVTAMPYQFDVDVQAAFKYTAVRSDLESLNNLDVTIEDTIQLGNTNPNLNYLTSYQGNISTAQLANIECVSSSGSNLYINTSNVSGSGVLFRAGDYIQPGGAYRYPYQVTSDVTFSATANLTIPVHRPVLSQPDYTLAGSALRVGSDVRWFVKQATKNIPRIVPGGLVVFEQPFQLVEVVI